MSVNTLMETITPLDLFKTIGYKDIFNFLYAHKYKDTMTFDEITQADYKQRQFFEQLLIDQPQEVFERVTLPAEEDPTEIAAALFFKLYRKIWKSQ